MKLKFIPIMTLVATMLLSSTVFGAPGKVINGRTMIPLRGAFEELGFTVSWDNKTSSATLKDAEHTIVMTQNSTTYYVDGVKYTTDVAPQLVNGSMYIPLRTLGDKIGAETSWDNTTETATIEYNGNTSVITTGATNTGSTNNGSTNTGSTNNGDGTTGATTTTDETTTPTTPSNNELTDAEIEELLLATAELMDLMYDTMNEGVNFVLNDQLQEAYDSFILLEEVAIELEAVDYSFISAELEEIVNSFAYNMYDVAINLEEAVVSLSEGDSASEDAYLDVAMECLVAADADAERYVSFVEAYVSSK